MNNEPRVIAGFFVFWRGHIRYVGCCHWRFRPYGGLLFSDEKKVTKNSRPKRTALRCAPGSLLTALLRRLAAYGLLRNHSISRPRLTPRVLRTACFTAPPVGLPKGRVDQDQDQDQDQKPKQSSCFVFDLAFDLDLPPLSSQAERRCHGGGSAQRPRRQPRLRDEVVA